MKDQLLKLLQSEGLTPAKLADEIGVQRSSISHILSDRNKPSFDFIVKILNRFSGINAEWLITGKGNMIKGESSSPMKVIQQDLFEEYAKSKNQVKLDIKETIENTQNSNDFGINKQAKNYKIDKSNETTFKEFTNVNNQNFIVVFYNDGTFEKFIPRKQDNS
jgi:transcriptional regulator with XRE-family HTH domain